MRNIDWKRFCRSQSGSILMIVCGAILAVNPDSASVLISVVVGWLVIAVGVALLITGFVGGKNVGSILKGALCLVGGAWLHRHPLMIASVLGFVLGILVLYQGVNALNGVLGIRRSGGVWIPGAVLAALELLVGLRLLLSPLSVSRLVLSVAGIIMVVCGACSLVAYSKSTKYIRGSSNIIDADE